MGRGSRVAARLVAPPCRPRTALPIATEEQPVLYMVIEHYTSGPGPIYERAARLGRMLPDGLRYLDS